MALLVIRNLLSELRDKVRPLGSRTDKVHIASQNVPELRNLVDADFANDATHARHAIVAVAGPNRTILFRVSAHRAELHQREWATVLTNAFLLVKNRTARVNLDQDQGHEGDWQRENRADESYRAMNHDATDFIEARAATTAREDQPTGPNQVEQHTTSEPLIK